MIRITSLVDHRGCPGYSTEFGLALYIEAYGERILFDTGAGSALLPNAERAGIDLAAVTRIVLSHGHYDHTSGLAKLTPAVPVCAGPDVTAPCISCHEDGGTHEITMPDDSKSVLKRADLHTVERFTEIADGIFLTGPIPRVSDENTGGNFFSDVACTVGNPIPEEQALLLKDGILVTGCCHAGIINTVEACRAAEPDIPIRVIAGGLHLMHAGEARLKATADYLASLRPEKLILMHCTGESAEQYLAEHLDCEVVTGIAGSVCYEGK